MSYASAGKLLVSLLLVMCSGRVFFLRRAASDALSSLSMAALPISVLQVAANGADALSLALVLVALFTFIINLHALSRLMGNLVVDHYGALFVTFSVLSLVISLFLGFVAVYFAPVAITPSAMQKMGVKMERVRYRGALQTGFEEAKPLQKANAEICIFTPALKTDNDEPVVIVAADGRAGIAGYAPYMAYVAAEGCTVIAGSFSEGKWLPMPFGARPFRRLALAMVWLFDKSGFNKQHEFYTFAEMHEVEALLDIAAARYGERAICLVSDEMSALAVQSVAAQSKKDGKEITIYPLEDVLVQPGLGFVQQTDPLLAWKLSLPPDRTFFAVQKTAKDTAAALYKGGSDDAF